MGPSPTLVRPGTRTPARPGWRAGVVAALLLAASRPSLWLLGSLGFMVRGGAFLLLLPVLVLPSPVALRLLVGDNLTSAGLAPGFYVLLALAAAGLVGLLLACLAVAAAVEVAAFRRQTGRSPARGATGGVFLIQLAATLTLAVAAVPLAAEAVQATYAELLRPSLGGSLYERVLAQLGAPLFFLLAVLVVVEAATAAATRRLLGGLTGVHRSVSALRAGLIGLGRPLLHPLSTLGTAAVGWLVSLLVLAPALWALRLAWDAARAALLPGSRAEGGEVTALLAVLLLCGAWLGTLMVAGMASALRAALWTGEELR